MAIPYRPGAFPFSESGSSTVLASTSIASVACDLHSVHPQHAPDLNQFL
jgi:hypothetical protein